MSRTRAILLEDALAEIKRLRQSLHLIADIDDKRYISNGKKVDMVKRIALMALTDVDEP